MVRCGLAALMMAATFAATAAETPAPAAPAPPSPGPVAPPPFQGDLLRFSEILGAVSWLDSLCGSADPAVWRGQMQALIDGQSMQPEDRRRYVDAFNRGYRTFSSVHRSCTPRTRAVLQRYFAEGAAISDRLDERFGRGPGDPAAAPR